MVNAHIIYSFCSMFQCSSLHNPAGTHQHPNHHNVHRNPATSAGQDHMAASTRTMQTLAC